METMPETARTRPVGCILDRSPEPKMEIPEYNFVDPDSRVMHDNAKKCFIQGYNAQIAVDSHAQVIVAAELTQQTNDREQVLPMVQAVKETNGRNPEVITADAGYWDTCSLRDSALEEIQMLVSPDAQPQTPGAPLSPHVPNNTDSVRMRELLATEFWNAAYGLRKCIVEPVFGQIKEARGIRRFRLRGLHCASCEWKLICATHNLLKLFRHRAGNGGYQPRKRLLRARFLAHGPRFSPSCRSRLRHHCQRRVRATPVRGSMNFSPTGSQAVPIPSIPFLYLIFISGPQFACGSFSLCSRLRAGSGRALGFSGNWFVFPQRSDRHSADGDSRFG